MEFRILEKKLMLLHHLSNLPETSLAAEILKVQGGGFQEFKIQCF